MRFKLPNRDLKAETTNVQKWPKKFRTFVGITGVKIIVAIYFIPLNARADSHGHFGMHRFSVAVLGAEIFVFEKFRSLKKFFKFRKFSFFQN